MTALYRTALYYPYIHVRDPDWLKATLLCFPQVVSLMPRDYPLHDLPEVKAFRDTAGLDGKPLLDAQELTSHDTYQPVEQAQTRLLTHLRRNEATVRRRYSRAAYGEAFPDVARGDQAGYHIYAGKMWHPLRAYLEDPQRQLAWYPRQLPGGQRDEEWLGVHPRLGEAIMSVTAIAVAHARGMDIVTDSGHLHHALAVRSEAEAVGQLLGAGEVPAPTPLSETVDELALVVMRTTFDLGKLSPDDIAGLIRDGMDLRRFKDALVPFARSIDDLYDPKARQERLEQEAERVRGEWAAYRKALLPRIAGALLEAGDIQTPLYATGLVAGGATLGWVYAGAGLALAVVTFKGHQVYRKFKEGATGPYSYLSRIDRSGATLAAGPAA